MPLGSSSAAPVIRPGPIFARGCFLTRRQRSASDLARVDFLCCLDSCTVPHLRLLAKDMCLRGLARLPSIRFHGINNAFTCILVLTDHDNKPALIFSAIMMVGMLVFAVGRRGMTEASAT